MASPIITVIVCTRDRPVQLERCLRALSQQTYPDFDVLVVDNASMQPSQKLCERWGASYVVAPVPGLTRARNVGARSAHSELIAYIDDDAEAQPGWLDAIVASFEDAQVAAVTGRICEQPDELPTNKFEIQRVFDRETPEWFTLASFGHVGRGGNMAFRRKLVAALQPFDERLGCGRLIDGGDEHTMFAGLIEKGLRIVYNPLATVLHAAPATEIQRKNRKLRKLRSAIAYILFTWAESPAHRKEIGCFLKRAVRKRIRLGRRTQAGERLPAWERFCAMCTGIVLYGKARKEWRGTAGEGIQAPKIERRTTLAGAAKEVKAMQGFWHEKRIFVSGGSGFIGAWVVEALKRRGIAERDIVIANSRNCDLRHYANCERALRGCDIIIHLAAPTGGIAYSRAHPASQFHDCSLINLNLLEAARQEGIQKFVALGNLLAYPAVAPSPLSETALHDGPIASTHLGIGLAKREMVALAEMYHHEYGLNVVNVLSANAYGPGDRFDEQHSHVIPATIAKCFRSEDLVVWGDGSPTRDFLYVEDIAEGILLAAEQLTAPDYVNLASGREISIAELVRMIAGLCGFRRNIIFDTAKGGGDPRRVASTARATALLKFAPKVPLEEGLRRTIDWYCMSKKVSAAG